MNLYEWKPTLCVLAGLLVGLLMDNMLGRIAAAVLIFAGMVIFNKRLNYRTNGRVNFGRR